MEQSNRPQDEPSFGRLPDGSALASDPLWQRGLFAAEKGMLGPDVPNTLSAPGQYSRFNLNVDGQAREYEVYRSTQFDSSKPAKVVLGLHGSFIGQDGARGLFAKETGFDEEVESRGGADNTLLVYPIANNRKANFITGQTWNYAGHKNIFDTWTNYDDGKYMDAVLADLKGKVNVGQIEGVGFGDGGRFLKAYSDEHPGLFSKVAVQNGTTLGDTPTNPVSGVKTDYLFIHSIRDPAKSGLWDRILHPFTTNLTVPFDGGNGVLGSITPNVSGMADSHPDQLKVEAARQDSCTAPPVITDGATTITTTYQGCPGGNVQEVLEKGTQMAWNDIHKGDGGHGMFALVGSRSDFGDTDRVMDFLMKKDPQKESTATEAGKPNAEPSVTSAPEVTVPEVKAPEVKAPVVKAPDEAAPPIVAQPNFLDQLKPLEGKPITGFQNDINPRLGCALAVSAGLHAQDDRIAITNNVDALKNELLKLGYQMTVKKVGEVDPKDLQANDVMLGYRQKGMPGHAAIYKGDGKLFENNSDTGKIAGDGDVQKFNKAMHFEDGRWNANGFEQVVILRRQSA